MTGFGGRVGGGYAPLGPRGLAHPYSNIGLAATNARVRGGLSSMGSNEFGHGAVPAHQMAIDSRTLRQGGMVSGRMPVQPTKASYQSVSRPVNPSSVPSHSMAQQHFYNGAQNGSITRAGVGSSGRSFTAPAAAHTMVNGNSSFANHSNGNGNANSSAAHSSPATQGNWHTFTPPSSHAAPGNSGGASAAGRGYSAPTNRSYARPSLNMSRPIVAPRSTPFYGGGSSGSRTPANTYRPPAANTYRPPTNTYRAPNQSSSGRPSPTYRAPANSGGGSNNRNSGRSAGGGGGQHASGGSGHSGGHPH